MNTERKIEPRGVVVRGVSTEGIQDGIIQWIIGNAIGLKYLLSHADDGVIWGRCDQGRWITSWDVAQNDEEAAECCPQLRIETLQQCRIFCPDSELLVWHAGNSRWNARLAVDAVSGDVMTFPESFLEGQILWGTRARSLRNDFSLMSDGAQGLRHVVPLPLSGSWSEKDRPLRLIVRHYIQTGEDGFVRIALSRLVNLEVRNGR